MKESFVFGGDQVHPTLKIKNVEIAPVAGFLEQHRYPFQMEDTPLGMRRLAIHLRNASFATPSNVADLGASVLQHVEDAVPVKIDGGWDVQRYSVKLVVESYVAPNTEPAQYVVMGYSIGEGDDLSFRINAITDIRKFYHPMGGHVVSSGSNHYLVPDPLSDIGGPYDVIMRPMDVLNAMQLTSMMELFLSTGDVVDSRVAFTGIPRQANRDNVIGSHWLSNSVSAYVTGKEMSKRLGRNHDVYNLARQQAQETSPSRQPFLRALSLLQGVQHTVDFKFDDLVRIDPDVKERLAKCMHDAMHQAKSLSQDLHPSLYPDPSSSYGVIAYKLALGYAALSARNLIQRSTIAYKRQLNDDGTYDEDVGIGFDQPPTMLLEEAVEGAPGMFHTLGRLVTAELFPEVMPWFHSMDIVISCDLMGVTQVTIRANGEKEGKKYTFPTFCDSLLSPLITTRSALDSNAITLKGLIEEVMAVRNPAFADPNSHMSLGHIPG